MPNYDWYSDTDPSALKVFLAQQRKMSASEKIAAVFQLNQMLWHTTEAHERNLHPEADEREIFLRSPRIAWIGKQCCEYTAGIRRV